MTTINPLAAALAALFDQSLQAAVTSSRELDENEVRDLVGRVTAPTVDRLDGRIDAHADRLDGRIDAHAAMMTLTLQGLHERIAKLEARVGELDARVASVVEQLANRLWSADQVTLEQRLTALATLETRLAALEAAPDLQRFDDELAYLTSRVSALETAPAGLQRFADDGPMTVERVREIAAAAAEEALDEHCSLYDHDDYDSHVNDDDKHFDGDVGEAVREALDGQSFTISL